MTRSRLTSLFVAAIFALGVLLPSASFAAKPAPKAEAEQGESHAAGESAAGHAAHYDDGKDHIEHWSVWVEIFPASFFENIRKMIGPSWLGGNEKIYVSHVIMAIFVFLLGLGLALSARRRLKNPDEYLLPPKKMNALNFFDILIDALLSIMEGMMPRDKALKFLPLVVSFAVFILLSNCLGLVPGLLPATDSLNTTFALGLVSFIAYNFWGIKQQGIVNYLKHFMGPLLILAPLIFVIEMISHFVRPCSLALRLLGNMFGDHMVLSIFMGFNIIFVPLPVMVLGLLVCVVQTVVFTMLTIVYIALAVEEHEHHDDHGHEHGHGEHAHAH